MTADWGRHFPSANDMYKANKPCPAFVPQLSNKAMAAARSTSTSRMDHRPPRRLRRPGAVAPSALPRARGDANRRATTASWHVGLPSAALATSRAASTPQQRYLAGDPPAAVGKPGTVHAGRVQKRPEVLGQRPRIAVPGVHFRHAGVVASRCQIPVSAAATPADGRGATDAARAATCDGFLQTCLTVSRFRWMAG